MMNQGYSVAFCSIFSNPSTYPLIFPPTHPLVHLPTHAFTFLTHSPSYSTVHPFTLPSTHPPSYFHTHPFTPTHPFIHSHISPPHPPSHSPSHQTALGANDFPCLWLAKDALVNPDNMLVPPIRKGDRNRSNDEIVRLLNEASK